MHNSIKRGIVAAAVAVSALGAGAGIAASAAGPASAATTAAVVVQAPHSVLGSWQQFTLTANGTTYSGYWLLLHQHRDGLVTGWLYDPNVPSGQSRYLRVTGDVSNGGASVQFSVTYPAADGSQGTRSFVVDNSTGHGVWDELGSEGLSGTIAIS